MTIKKQIQLVTAVFASLVMTACEGAGPLQPESAVVGGGVSSIEGSIVGDLTTSGPVAGVIKVCKAGNISGNFAVTTASVGGSTTSAPNSPTIVEGTCVVVATNSEANMGQDVTITETNAEFLQGITGEGIDVVTGQIYPITFANGGTLFTNRYHGYTVTFTNYRDVPPPTASAGCTPGYWKQKQHWDSWTAPLAPTMLFVTAFGVDAFPGKTLLDVVSNGGGGLKALGRHSVAALLNSAAGVQSGLTTAQVISAFGAAYASGDFETQKNIFEGLNELGCPLN